MSKQKNAFLVYTNTYQIVKRLSNEKSGILFKALYEYYLFGALTETDDEILEGILEMFYLQINMSEEAYTIKCEVNRINGLMRNATEEKKEALTTRKRYLEDYGYEEYLKKYPDTPKSKNKQTLANATERYQMLMDNQANASERKPKQANASLIDIKNKIEIKKDIKKDIKRCIEIDCKEGNQTLSEDYKRVGLILTKLGNSNLTSECYRYLSKNGIPEDDEELDFSVKDYIINHYHARE